MLWALKDSPTADTTERLVLVALGEKSDSDGCNAFPSRRTMAKAGLCDVKTVQRKLKAMQERGLIALGDQSAARYIPERTRPKVYDLLIPCSWYGVERLTRINEEREQRGLPPLTPTNRPDIAPPPPKARRSDLGKKRPEARGDSQSPLADGGRGDSQSRGRGDSQSPQGGLSVPQSVPVTLASKETLSLSPLSADPNARAGLANERESSAAPDTTKTTPANAEGLVPEQRDDREQPEGSAVVVAAYAAALGRPVVNGTRAALAAQAAKLLADGLPVDWLADRAREMAPKGWTDLEKHVERSTVPVLAASLSARPGLPEWCGRCGDGNPAAQFNPRFRTVTGMPSGQKCRECHPETAQAGV
ncbi:helix-turn-helix domain-containing protein [Kitasatospora sp. GP82]|uniref:helix-turn-helix domain-containing protein n=1 Tax=Kitasatospora sp. GP82 TaxID=3035089 RepID=UPI0024737959|nr:helix-turn-helix domain-containing protein [Kitasatospora sp. GP82]MDH6130363.1 hypothetical protein [Kitasatospora sp. GP82]